MNHGLKHPSAQQHSSNFQQVDGTVRPINYRSRTEHRAVHPPETGVIPLPNTGEPVSSSRPAFNQPQGVGFVSLSDRIASQAQDLTPGRKAVAAVRPSGFMLKFGSITKTVRAVGQNPQSLVFSTLVILLAGVFVHFFVTG
jgi:hypothetical protein